MMTHTGSCHCGNVRFTVNADFKDAITCNCSHCHRKGFVLAFVPTDAFTLESGEDSLTDYLFNTKKIVHRFCSTCGVEAFAEGREMGQVAVNLRCIEGLDLDSLTNSSYEGKDM
jgi:hypothetical protein